MKSAESEQSWPSSYASSKPVISLLANLMDPPPRRHAGQWADEHRRLPPGSPEPGPWRSSRVPYFDPILAEFEDPAVTEITVITASQMGKTETILNLFGKRLHEGPRAPCLYVAPTQDVARSISQERATAMLEHTPALRALWERGHRDKVAEKYLAGIRWGFAWAGSKSQLASRPCGLAVLDELDRMDPDVEGEGSPVVLVRARLKNYPRATLAEFSTPTVAGVSPSEALFDLGSREFWEWQCPECETWFAPWSRFLRWPKDATPDQAARRGALECPGCGHRFRDLDKIDLNAVGRFRQYKADSDGQYHPDPDPPPKGAHRSYWILGAASPWVTFSGLIRELVSAYRTRDKNTIQAVINTYAGELWREQGEAPAWREVDQLRMGNYPRGQVPSWAQALTAGVDVQKDCLYYVIRAWGHGLTSHLVEHGQVYGEPEYDAVWLALWRILETPRDQPLLRAFIDSGYKPGESYRTPDHQVYRFARRHAPLVQATKGYATQRKPIHMTRIDLTLDGHTIPRGLRLWHLDAPYWKTWVYGRLRWPPDSELGRWTIHASADEDYCRQVVAEEQINLPSGRIIMRTPRHRADHYGDCEALAAAAAFSLHLENLPAPQPPAEPARAVTPAPRQPPPGLERRGLV